MEKEVIKSFGYNTSVIDNITRVWNETIGDNYKKINKTIYIDKEVYKDLCNNYHGLVKKFFSYQNNITFRTLDEYVEPTFLPLVYDEEDGMEYNEAEVNLIESKQENTKKEEILKRLEEELPDCDYGDYFEIDKNDYNKLKEIVGINFQIAKKLKDYGFKVGYGKMVGGWTPYIIYKDNYTSFVDDEKIEMIKNKVIEEFDTKETISDIFDIYNERIKGFYIYAIVGIVEGERKIFYIGKTTRSLSERWEEHLTTKIKSLCIVKGSVKGVGFVNMYAGDEIQTNYDLQRLEKCLIEYYKPMGNIEGVKREYVFR